MNRTMRGVVGYEQKYARCRRTRAELSAVSTRHEQNLAPCQLDTLPMVAIRNLITGLRVACVLTTRHGSSTNVPNRAPCRLDTTTLVTTRHQRTIQSIDCPGKSFGLNFIPNQSDLCRFIPKSVSAPIRTHPIQSEKSFQFRLMYLVVNLSSTYSTWTAHCGRRSVIGNRKRGQSVKTFCPFLSFFYWLKGFSMKGVQDCNTQNKNHGKVCKYLVL